MINKLISYIVKYKIIIIWLVILSLFGLTLFKLQAISNPSPDRNYLETKQQGFKTDRITIKQSVREQIDALENTQVNTQPSQVGTPDPFNP